MTDDKLIVEWATDSGLLECKNVGNYDIPVVRVERLKEILKEIVPDMHCINDWRLLERNFSFCFVGEKKEKEGVE